jgi:hypothetical protein
VVIAVIPVFARAFMQNVSARAGFLTWAVSRAWAESRRPCVHAHVTREWAACFGHACISVGRAGEICFSFSSELSIGFIS